MSGSLLQLRTIETFQGAGFVKLKDQRLESLQFTVETFSLKMSNVQISV